IDAMREGNRVRKASERARKNGKGTRQVKKDKVLAYLTEHPEATNTEVAEKTGVSRPSVIKYRKEYAPALPAPKGGKIVKDDGTKVDTV
ncbi:winged helix-turn-helix domain-containing protein, partial [Coprococcus comes]